MSDLTVKTLVYKTNLGGEDFHSCFITVEKLTSGRRRLKGRFLHTDGLSSSTV